MSDNPARPPPGTLIARLHELNDGEARAFDFRAGAALFSLILARQGEQVWAFENVCPHAGHPLERLDGTVMFQAARYLVCASHGASFAVRDGACVGGPCAGKALTRVEIAVEGEDLRLA